MTTVTNTVLGLLQVATLCLLFAATPPAANAMLRESGPSTVSQTAATRAGAEAAQQRGMSLSAAVDSVRRRGNVERIISAQTRVSRGREVHYVKVLTKDGKVRTHKIPGRVRN